MKSTILTLAILMLLPVSLFAERSGIPMPAAAEIDPRVQALDNYKRGQRRLDDVAKLQEKLKTATNEKSATKLRNKIAKQLENAAGDFKRAIKDDPSLFQAHSELGFALRKIGRYDESLQAYNQALRLEPGFTPAIEYRAEAYLGLNRVDEARQAYLVLFSGDRPRADVLFEAMQQWVEQRRADPAGTGTEQIEQFAKWVEQRAPIHRQTSQTAGSSSGRSW